MWEGIELPTWNSDSAYELFNRVISDACAKSEDDAYCRMMMSFVKMHWSQYGMHKSLARCRLDPDDVAAEAVFHLRRKAPKFNLQTPCVKVYQAVLNISLKRFLLSKIGDQARKSALETSETDFYKDEGLGDMDEHELDQRISGTPAGDDAQLSRLLHAAEDIVCRDIPNLAKRVDIVSVVKLYRMIRRGILLEHEFIPHYRLPERMQKTTPLELHALITGRLARVLYAYAQEGV